MAAEVEIKHYVQEHLRLVLYTAVMERLAYIKNLPGPQTQNLHKMMSHAHENQWLSHGRSNQEFSWDMCSDWLGVLQMTKIWFPSNKLIKREK